MLNFLELFHHKPVKTISTPNPGLEHRLVFKKGAVPAIMAAKGWRSLSEMARDLGLTKAYISMLSHTRCQATSTVVTRLAVAMGNTEKNWWVHFEIIPWGVPDLNHPMWNEEKYKGRVPYDRFSTSVQIRGLDYDAEKIGPITYIEVPGKRRKILKKHLTDKNHTL